MRSGLFTAARNAKRAFVRPAVGLAALLTLAGCNAGWEKPALDIATPAAFREQASGPVEPVRDDWPASFGSSELTALARAALDGNLDIGAAVARIDQADAQARIAAAPLFPQLSLTADTSRSQTPGTLTQKEGPFEETRRWRHALGLNASYAVDFWGRNRDAAGAARLSAVASRYDRSVVALSTTASLVNSYIALVAAQDRLRIARENAKVAAEVLHAIRQRVAVGTATALDLAQQESVLATQRAAAPAFEQTVQQTRNLIAVLVGRTPESMSVRGGSLMALRLAPVRAGLPSQLMLRRPDLAQAEASLASADLNVSAARAAFFPSIALSGQFSLQSMLLKNLFRPEAIAYTLATQLVQPILDGHNLQGQLELQKARYIELLMLYRKQILTAFSDVENALIALRTTAARETLLRTAVAASRRAYEAAIKRLQEGTIDIITLSTIQTTLFQNLDQLSQARQARLQALVSLYQALGGGWADEERAIALAGETFAHADVKSPLP